MDTRIHVELWAPANQPIARVRRLGIGRFSRGSLRVQETYMDRRSLYGNLCQEAKVLVSPCLGRMSKLMMTS